MSFKINNIEVPASQVGFLKSTYQKIYEEYILRRDKVLKEGEELEPVLKALGIIPQYSMVTSKSPTLFSPVTDREKSINNKFEIHFELFGEDKYSSDKWSWLQKCKHIIEIAGVPLTSNEIIDLMVRYFEPEEDKNRFVNSIPATLSVAAKEGKIYRRQNESNEYEYTLN